MHVYVGTRFQNVNTQPFKVIPGELTTHLRNHRSPNVEVNPQKWIYRSDTLAWSFNAQNGRISNGKGERSRGGHGLSILTLTRLTLTYKPSSSLCSPIPLLFFAEPTLDSNLSLLLSGEKKQLTSMVNAVKVFKKTAPNGTYYWIGSCETILWGYKYLLLDNYHLYYFISIVAISYHSPLLSSFATVINIDYSYRYHNYRRCY